MPFRPSGRFWLTVGASLAVSGGFAALLSLPVGGVLLWTGVGLIAAGSLALRMGLSTARSDSAGDAIAAHADQVPGSDANVESELRGTPPRNVVLTRRGILVVATWVLTLAVFASLAHQHFGRLPPPRSKSQIEAGGVQAVATVHSVDDRSVDGDRALYFIGYSFAVGSGIPVRINRSVPPRVFQRVKSGDELPVVYLPGNPERHYLPSITSPVSTRFVFFIGGLLLAAAGFAEAQRRLHRRLVSGGVPVAGFVADVRRRGGVRSFRVNFDAAGQRRSLSASERNPDLRSGQTATVLYNPAIPARAVIYRLALYRARP